MKYGLKEQDIERLQSIFANFKEIEKAVLYGSRAKGNYKPASDIDICLIGKDLTTNIISKIDEMIDDLLLPYYFDISIFHKLTSTKLIKNIETEGIEFYRLKG